MALHLAIFLLSAAAIAYEIVLLRLLSIVQWQHFAAMIISLALLGYGASGTFLTLARRVLQPRFRLVFASGAILFVATAVGSFAVAQRLPFNPLELPWNWWQLALLGAMYLIFAVPFFCAATSIGLAFTAAEGRIATLYRADLAGAGAGAIGAILVLSTWNPGGWLRPSQFKPLMQTLNVPGARVVEQRPSPLGLVSVVESKEVPLRFAPGLSLNYFGELPEQVGLFVDAAALTVINRTDAEDADYLDYVTAALPYALSSPKTVLVLNAGGGTEVLNALRHGARVDALEVNPEIVDVVRNKYANFSSDIYRRAGVITSQPRDFLAGKRNQYDLIVDSSSAGSGIPVLTENYIYTTQGIGQLIDRLTEGGSVAITRPVNIPPRDTIKLFATAVEALERAGFAQPAGHLVLIRGWNAATLLIKRNAFSTAEIDRIRGFCESRSFDVGFYRGMRREEANRFNILEEPFFYDGARALVSEESERFFRAYKFNVVPATDNRPFFAHFFKWRTLPELMRLRTRGGAPLLELGYLILVATLIQAAIAAVILILLPVIALKRSGLASSAVLVCFTALGVGFLSVEIVAIQKLTLLFGNPVLAFATALASFLIFAGIGSGQSRRFRRGIIPIIAIGSILLAFTLLWPVLFPLLISLPTMPKAICMVALIAPLAFFMGMPFPMAMENVGAQKPEWVPWAWTINGCASVISPVMATLIAIHAGFFAVICMAVMCYMVIGILSDLYVVP